MPGLLGIGQTVRSRENRVVANSRRRETAYAIYDPARHAWPALEVVRMPDIDGKFFHAGIVNSYRVKKDR